MDTFLFIISTNTDFDRVKFVMYNLKVPHCHQAHNCQEMKNPFHTKFRIFKSNGSIVVAIKPKAKHRFREAAMLLIYILQKRTFTKVAYFLWATTTETFKILHYGLPNVTAAQLQRTAG